jgi:hypothetical protein
LVVTNDSFLAPAKSEHTVAFRIDSPNHRYSRGDRLSPVLPGERATPAD